MQQRILTGLQQFIESANTEQGWFTGSTEKQGMAWLQRPLNEGVVNSFNFRSEQRTCTSAGLPFGDEYRGRSYNNITGIYNNDTIESFAEQTFWSCAFYPNFTRDYRDSLMTPENRSFITEIGVDTSAETSKNVTSFLSTCLIAYCENSDACKSQSSLCSPQHLVLNETLLSAGGVQSCLSDICKYDPWYSSNSDIVGIGVTLSYSIQLGIAVLSVLFYIWQGSKKVRHMGLNESRIRQRIRETVLIALDDFQRAQCCFIITVSIATLGALEDMTTADRRTVSAVTSNGASPTVLVLMTLMLSSQSRHSPFTFYLTFCAWICTFVVNFHPRITSAQKYPQPVACGRLPPTLICSFESVGVNPHWAVAEIPVPCMLLLTFFHIYRYDVINNQIKAWHLKANSWVVDTVKKLSKQGSVLPKIIKFAKWAGIIIVAIIIGAAALTAPASVAWAIVTNYQFWTVMTKVEWSFGQIIAMSVWLPTAVSFFNDCIHGPLIGRTNQLPLPLEVIRRGVSDADSTEPSIIGPGQDLEASDSSSSARQSQVQGPLRSLTTPQSTTSVASPVRTSTDSERQPITAV